MKKQRPKPIHHEYDVHLHSIYILLFSLRLFICSHFFSLSFCHVSYSEFHCYLLCNSNHSSKELLIRELKTSEWVINLATVCLSFTVYATLFISHNLYECDLSKQLFFFLSSLHSFEVHIQHMQFPWFPFVFYNYKLAMRGINYIGSLDWLLCGCASISHNSHRNQKLDFSSTAFCMCVLKHTLPVVTFFWNKNVLFRVDIRLVL